MYRAVCSVLSSAILALATATAAGAQAATATPIPPPPKPDLSTMTYFLGAWSCQERSARRPSAATYSETYTLDPNGYYIDVAGSSDGMPWYPYAETTMDRITYDPEASRWVDIEVGSLGEYDVSMSAGWSGNSLVWHDALPEKVRDIVSNSDTTLTKVSDTKFTIASSFTTTAGKTVGVSGSCTKQT